MTPMETARAYLADQGATEVNLNVDANLVMSAHYKIGDRDHAFMLALDEPFFETLVWCYEHEMYTEEVVDDEAEVDTNLEVTE